MNINKSFIIGLLTIGLFFMVNFSQAQIRCATVEYQKMLERSTPGLETTEEFENWMKEQVARRKASTLSGKRENATVIEIPVVVHIIHNGESIGIGRNLVDAQIESQIEVLNEDFRRLNADASNTPSIFQPVAADIEVEFKLAQRDPEGLPTNGIVRVDGGRSAWFLSDNLILKRLSIWPPEDYLNIWVTEIEQDFLGYAQFPTTNLISGLTTGSSNEATDGIVVHYRAFGSIEKYPPADLFSQYQLGRTTTHEIGHYLGLRHIWGDNSSCSINDFVTDTPPATDSNTGLGSPCTFPGRNSCTNDSPDQPEMFQNYMDFSDDPCMNLFTLGQKDRIRTILDNSPRRLSLVSSQGAIPPVVVSNDIGIRSIISPEPLACDAQVIPTLEIRNYGNNTVTALSIQTSLNGSVVSNDDFSVDLDNLDIQNVSLSPITLDESIENNITFTITSVNGMTDNNDDNNIRSIQTTVPPRGLAPFNINFNTFPTGWSINDMDEVITWELTNAPKETTFNPALGITFFDYEIEGELDLLESPLLDLTDVEDAILTFDVSYARYPGVFNEGLFITVSTMCEDQVFEADTVFFKLSSELETVVSTNFFVPSGEQDWRREVVSLRDFIGEENVRISFIAQNAFGNNLYIDNIDLSLTARPDIAISEVISPSVASCDDDAPLVVEFLNAGSLKLGYFEVAYELNNGGVQNEIIQLTDSLDINQSTTLQFEIPELLVGTNVINVRVSSPNQRVDADQTNNELNVNFVVDQSQDLVPSKETFEDASNITWFAANPDGSVGWENVRTNMGTSAAVNLINYEDIGQQDWLVSPILDFTPLNQVTLNFDVAYSFQNEQNDALSVLISTDCGSTYFPTDFQRTGNALKTGDFNGIPTADSLWQNVSVTLSGFTGEDNVRIAIVSTNANGNDIFVDNIQLFVTNFFNNAVTDLFPNPTSNGFFNLLFELDQRETVQIIIYDIQGHIISDQTLPNTLNQTYQFNLGNLNQGIYLVRVVGESFSFTRRVMNIN